MKKKCENCERVIGNLEESFFYKNNIVCKACKTLLEEDSQAFEFVNSNVKTEIPIAELQPQISDDTRRESSFNNISKQEVETWKKEYGGIRRTGYFLGMLGLAFLNVIIEVIAQEVPGMESIALGNIVILVLIFILVINRLHNIGRSGWWSLLLFIPIANLFVAIPCLICPEGYQDTKKLDTAGKIIAGIFIGLLALIFLGIFMAFF